MTTSVKVICDSYCEATGKRLISIEARYPRIIHEEVLTHRMLSRSASGSRAIPVARMIEQIRQDPFVPKRWGSNQRGMQAGEDIPFEARTEATAAWLTAHRAALDASDRLRRLNVVKHLANRIIEPWSHIDVIISATEWENFLMLRWHGAAAEEMEEFAHAIMQAVKVSAPTVLRPGEWHLPYVLAEEVEHGMPRAILWSVARCARVSYMKHGTSQIDYAADEALYSTLLESGHMSPFEHQAQATDRPVRSGNYTGWIQYRKLIPNEDVWALNPRAAEIRDALRVRRPNALATLAGILTGAEVPREDHRGHSEHDRPGPHHRRHEE